MNSGAQMVCHYTVLGLRFNASAEEISAAYAGELRRIKKHLALGKAQPVEHLDAVCNAYKTLSSPEARQRYDQARGETALGEEPVKATVVPAVDVADSVFPVRELAVEFRGSGAEYFRIWLVNIALTLLTLGLYSAWAKVRREKYFHRNLVLDGAAFDYHGKPRAILLGRAIVLILFMLGSLAENIGSSAKLLVSLGAMAIFPWLLVQSMRFRARYTSYRGLRFSFSGRYPQALVLYGGHGLLTLLTLGLYFPVFLQRQKAFLANNLRYGDQFFHFDAGIAAFYRGLAVPLALWGLALLGGGLAVGLALSGGKTMLLIALAVVIGPLIALLALYLNLIFAPIARVVGSNLLWNNMTQGETRFHSTQRVVGYLGIVLSNWLLTLLTLGFFWPLAEIRLAAYRARHLAVLTTAQGLALARAAGGTESAALGSEAMDAVDLDIGL